MEQSNVRKKVSQFFGGLSVWYFLSLFLGGSAFVAVGVFLAINPLAWAAGVALLGVGIGLAVVSGIVALVGVIGLIWLGCKSFWSRFSKTIKIKNKIESAKQDAEQQKITLTDQEIKYLLITYLNQSKEKFGLTEKELGELELTRTYDNEKFETDIICFKNVNAENMQKFITYIGNKPIDANGISCYHYKSNANQKKGWLAAKESEFNETLLKFKPQREASEQQVRMNVPTSETFSENNNFEEKDDDADDLEQNDENWSVSGLMLTNGLFYSEYKRKKGMIACWKKNYEKGKNKLEKVSIDSFGIKNLDEANTEKIMFVFKNTKAGKTSFNTITDLLISLLKNELTTEDDLGDPNCYCISKADYGEWTYPPRNKELVKQQLSEDLNDEEKELLNNENNLALLVISTELLKKTLKKEPNINPENSA